MDEFCNSYETVSNSKFLIEVLKFSYQVGIASARIFCGYRHSNLAINLIVLTSRTLQLLASLLG